MGTKTGGANAGAPGLGRASQGLRLQAAVMAASPGSEDPGLGRRQARQPEGVSGGAAAAAAAVSTPAVLSPLARAQLAKNYVLSSNGSYSSLTQAFKSGGKGPNHDPAATAQDCMCCAPQSLTEMAEMEDRRLRRGEGAAGGGGLGSSGRLQIAMALCALVALVGMKLRRSGFSKL